MVRSDRPHADRRAPHHITDPIIVPIRRRLPSAGFIDFSPMVALLVIFVVRAILGNALAGS